MTYIPVAKQCMGDEERQAIHAIAESLQLAGGAKIEEFEKLLPSHFGQKTRALFVNSGSSANLIAISSLGLKPGDEVITAACGFPTTVNPIIQCGATPVFVDVNPRTLNVEYQSIINATTSKTKAVVLAHTLGNPFRADQVALWCDDNNFGFVEDCCDAFGSTIKGKPVGSWGNYATCSFYPAHHVSTGEGGAVFSSSGRGRKMAASFRDWGRDCWCDPGCDNTCGKRFGQCLGSLPAGYDHKYTYSQLGYNLKATEIQAAVGVEQLKKVHGFIEARKHNWKALDSEIKGSSLKYCLTPIEPTPETDPSWFGFPMYLRHDLDRAKLMAYLELAGIGTRLVFAGNLTKQPAYRDVKYRVHGDLTATDMVMRQTFWVGVHPGIGSKEIGSILESLEKGIRAQI